MQPTNPPTRQPHETIPQFLARLPPAQAETTFLPHLRPPWYWISNPNSNQNTTGDVNSFTVEGAALLRQFNTAALIQREDEDKARLREELKWAIGQAAKKWGVTMGKWMVFPHTNQVNEAWRIVCEAVDAGRLGIGAKVSTASNKPGDPTRFICVYTRDFTDVEDVGRVLLGLVEMRLVRADVPGGNMYKCDAYTYLGIYGGNEYGLPASIYGSRDMLAGMAGRYGSS